MNISHAKTTIMLVAACALAAALAGGATTLSASAEEAKAKDAALFLPTSYEQYLQLEAPSVAAFSAGHIAIADGDKLYLFDRDKECYTETAVPVGESVTQLGFAGERLFVSTRSASNYFYEYDFGSGTFNKSGINFTTFCIDGNTLYTANVGGTSTTIASYRITAEGVNETAAMLGTLNEHTTPNMTIIEGNLYCAFEHTVYFQNENRQFDDKSCFFLSNNAPEVTQVNSVCAVGNYFYYTAREGLYRTDSASNSKLIAEGEDFSALTAFGGKLYMIAGSSIKELVPTEEGAKLSGYEIAASSDSENRLVSATDSARAGDLLVTLDTGCGRVSVYNFATKKYSQISGIDELSPTHVATDGTIIALSTEHDIYCATYSEKEEMTFAKVKEGTQSPICGIVCVYGEVYYVTGNIYGKVGGEEVFHATHDSPCALASDVYGDLFVVCGSAREVVRYTEREFCNADAEGEVLPFRLPEGFFSLRADFEGNLYYLLGDTLQRNGDEVIATVHGSDHVYTMSEGDPLAFALGYEDDAVYFLFENYIVATLDGALDIPTLDEIDAGNVREEIFCVHGKENLFVDIPAGTIGIRTDLDGLKADAADGCFPYEFYFRTKEDARGVLLAKKDGFALVELYESEDAGRTFTANLFHIDLEKEDLLVPRESYWTDETATKYLSSDVSLYFYPCLPSALADARLVRGSKVEVKGVVHAAEQYDYAFVEYTSAEKAVLSGYVPVDYLSDDLPFEPSEEEFLFATLKKNPDGYLFMSGEESLTLYGGERVRLEKKADGTYTARYSDESGNVFSAVIEEKYLDFGQNDSLRIALIAILSVVAVLIVGLYVWFLPKKKKN